MAGISEQLQEHCLMVLPYPRAGKSGLPRIERPVRLLAASAGEVGAAVALSGPGLLASRYKQKEHHRAGDSEQKQFHTTPRGSRAAITTSPFYASRLPPKSGLSYI